MEPAPYCEGFGDAVIQMSDLQETMCLMAAQDQCIFEWRLLEHIENEDYAGGWLEGTRAMVDLQLDGSKSVRQAEEACGLHAVVLAEWDGQGSPPQMNRRRFPDEAPW
jgi:hypothetical protein